MELGETRRDKIENFEHPLSVCIPLTITLPVAPRGCSSNLCVTRNPYCHSKSIKYLVGAAHLQRNLLQTIVQAQLF